VLIGYMRVLKADGSQVLDLQREAQNRQNPLRDNDLLEILWNFSAFC
jgi:hypothetical protein